MKGKIEHRIKKILFGFIGIVLFLPVLQKVVGFIELEPLNGAFEEARAPKLTVDRWFNGKYQDENTTYVEEHIGFRNFFVRFYNQQYFSLYKESRANGVVVGKEDFLYEKNYINAYLGRDFIGDSLVNIKVDKLERINDTLQKLGKEIVVLLAPGKGSFYPEYIPNRFNPSYKTRTNYEAYSSELEKRGLHILNFHEWFNSMKKSSKYPLYPKTGIHWSNYGEILAADSLIKYLDWITDRDFPLFTIDSVSLSTEIWYGDDDVEKGMNLLYNIEDLEMGYPTFKIQKDSTIISPKVLTISDSYFWGMFNWGMSQDVFGGGQFWYYNKQIYPDSYEKPITVGEINIISSVEENDVILIICTDANLNRFAFGFIDQVYEAYFGFQ